MYSYRIFPSGRISISLTRTMPISSSSRAMECQISGVHCHTSIHRGCYNSEAGTNRRSLTTQGIDVDAAVQTERGVYSVPVWQWRCGSPRHTGEVRGGGAGTWLQPQRFLHLGQQPVHKWVETSHWKQKNRVLINRRIVSLMTRLWRTGTYRVNRVNKWRSDWLVGWLVSG